MEVNKLYIHFIKLKTIEYKRIYNNRNMTIEIWQLMFVHVFSQAKLLIALWNYDVFKGSVPIESDFA